MGQNFLVDPQVVNDIVDVAQVQAGNEVVEIGPGLGILTRELLGRKAHVLAVELDRDLKSFLEKDLAAFPNLTLIERDARHVELGQYLGERAYQVVANLPYSTGTVIIRRFLELERPPTSMTVMVQREVAERMVATVPSMSLLSLATQMFSTPELAFIVPPDVFLPPPKVESAVVHLTPHQSPLASPIEREKVFELATMAFQRKRKTIINGVSQGLGLPKPEVDGLLSRAGIDVSLRPQALALESWIDLARLVLE
jgi:16S rRNA (adenine1518-N6/adenine1519-N6)-dimethyltransferase